MGSIITSTHAHPVELSSSTLIGRGHNCDIRIQSERVPNFWIELRWLKEAWAWRVLTAEDATRGAGKVGRHGWRVLPKNNPSSRIVLGAHAWVSLVESAPPQPLARCLRTGSVCTGEALRKLLARHRDEVGGQQRASTGDGAILVEADHVWRISIPRIKAVTPTHVRVPRLSTDLIWLAIKPESLEATFTVGDKEVMVQGEPVRTLLIYARESLRGGTGWLDNETAWRRWVLSGGNATSSSDRLGWDRGKLRTALRANGIEEVGSLFERRRQHGVPLLRLGLDPSLVEIVGEPSDA